MKKNFRTSHQTCNRAVVTTKKELKQAISNHAYQITVTGDLVKELGPVMKLMALPQKKKQALLATMIGGTSLVAVGTVALPVVAAPAAVGLAAPGASMFVKAAAPTALTLSGVHTSVLIAAIAVLGVCRLYTLMKGYDETVHLETGFGSVTYTQKAPRSDR